MSSQRKISRLCSPPKERPLIDMSGKPLPDSSGWANTVITAFLSKYCGRKPSKRNGASK